jgi:hypothetical protein
MESEVFSFQFQLFISVTDDPKLAVKCHVSHWIPRFGRKVKKQKEQFYGLHRYWPAILLSTTSIEKSFSDRIDLWNSLFIIF